MCRPICCAICSSLKTSDCARPGGSGSVWMIFVGHTSPASSARLCCVIPIVSWHTVAWADIATPSTPRPGLLAALSCTDSGGDHRCAPLQKPCDLTQASCMVHGLCRGRLPAPVPAAIQQRGVNSHAASRFVLGQLSSRLCICPQQHQPSPPLQSAAKQQHEQSAVRKQLLATLGRIPQGTMLPICQSPPDVRALLTHFGETFVVLSPTLWSPDHSAFALHYASRDPCVNNCPGHVMVISADGTRVLGQAEDACLNDLVFDDANMLAQVLQAA